MKLIELVNKATHFLEKNGVNNARFEAQLMLQHLLGFDRAQFLIRLRENVDGGIQVELQELLKRRSQGVPLQYLLGEQEFMGLPFRVNPAVLIPRPETELLVEQVLEWSKPHGQQLRIADIGTGSGAIAVSLAHYLPLARVWAVDISEAALEVASENANLNGVADRVSFLHGDLLDPLKTIETKFDVIVSNPPYITEAEMKTLQREVQQEPSLALVGGRDGLDYYRRLVRWAPKLLQPGGLLAVEIGSKQGEAVIQLYEQAGFNEVALLQDLAGLDRVVRGVWHKCVPSH